MFNQENRPAPCFIFVSNISGEAMSYNKTLRIFGLMVASLLLGSSVLAAD